MVSSHFFRNLMETEENRDDRIRLAAMIWYAETRAAGFDREQAGALVRRLFRDEIAEGVIRDAADLQFFRDQYGIAGDIKKIY